MASSPNITPSSGSHHNGGGGGLAGGSTSGSGASSGSNPRKFSEKIALHKQREAEEKKEFEKMMNELKAVKGPSPQRIVGSNMMPHMTSPIHNGGYIPNHPTHSHQRHLSPHMASAVPRHGSLPNVNAAMAAAMSNMPNMQNVISSEDFPLILNSQNGGTMNGPNSGSGLGGSHVSVRDTVHGGTGPIRNRSRMNTSPYGSDRHSPGGYHLSPPDPSWRRVVSDSAIHKSVNDGGNQDGGGGGTAGLLALVNGGQCSPLRGASPTTLQARVPNHHQQGPSASPSHLPSGCSPHPRGLSPSIHDSEVQNMDHMSNFLLPQDKDGADTKNNPGSLPDLTNFHVNTSPASVGGHTSMENEDHGSPYSSSPVTGNSPCGMMGGTQWSPGTIPSSPHSPILTVTPVPDPSLMGSNLPTTPIPISQFQQVVSDQVFFPNSLPNVSSVLSQVNPPSVGSLATNQYFEKQQASLPVTPWLHKRYPHLAQSPSPGVIHEFSDDMNPFFGFAQPTHVNPPQPLMMGSLPMSSSTSGSNVVFVQSSRSSTTSCVTTSANHGGSVHLSDNDICKILSIPMNMLTEPSQMGQDDLDFDDPPDGLLNNYHLPSNMSVNSQQSPLSVVTTTKSVPGGGHAPNGHNGRQPPKHNNNQYSCDNNQIGSTTTTTSAGATINTTKERNFLHMSKGMTTDQGALHNLHQEQFGAYNNSQVNHHQRIHNGPNNESLSTYRSTNIHSPVGQIQGSPHGRSTSPIEMIGSPNSPSILGTSPLQSPPSNSLMSGGGIYTQLDGFQPQQQQNQAAQSELAKDFQKFSVVESTNAIYCQDMAAAMYASGGVEGSSPSNYKNAPPTSSSQPINEFAGFFNNYCNDQTFNGKGNYLINNQQQQQPDHHHHQQYQHQQQLNSMAPHTPQTPSSIPDIILTDVDEDGGGNYHSDLGANFDAESWSQELSANMADIIRDDSMLKLLSEGSSMPLDQQIADPLTEEHLKS